MNDLELLMADAGPKWSRYRIFGVAFESKLLYAFRVQHAGELMSVRRRLPPNLVWTTIARGEQAHAVLKRYGVVAHMAELLGARLARGVPGRGRKPPPRPPWAAG